MNQLDVLQALEKALLAVDATLEHIPPNSGKKPTGASTPHMVDYLMPNDPDNSASGNIFCERGLFKVNLRYPLGDGARNAVLKAEAIRAAFKRGTTFTQNGSNVQITQTPTIHGGYEDNGYWLVPITIPWQVWAFT